MNAQHILDPARPFALSGHWAEALLPQLQGCGLGPTARLLLSVDTGAETLPAVLLAKGSVLFLDFAQKSSLAAQAAQCDRLFAQAKRFSLFHKPSEGKPLRCLLLTDDKKAKPFDHYQCRVLPAQALGAYLSALPEAGPDPDPDSWLSAAPPLGLGPIQDRIDKSLARWAKFLLDGWLQDARDEMQSLEGMGFRAYQTGNYAAAKEYCAARYGDTRALYGFATSSEAENMLLYGSVKGYGATGRIQTEADAGWEERWFDLSAPDCGRSFKRAIYEHQLKGKRLDFEVLGWGDDMRWAGRWKPKKTGFGMLSADFGMNLSINGYYRPKPKNPSGQLVEEQPNYRLGAYNVLLTAPKDGLIFFTVSDLYIDTNKNALLRAGAQTHF